MVENASCLNSRLFEKLFVRKLSVKMQKVGTHVGELKHLCVFCHKFLAVYRNIATFCPSPFFNPVSRCFKA